MALEIYHPGLEGVCVGETNITSPDHGVQYRGYALRSLIEHASFAEVAYLLLYGELPNLEELADFNAILADEADITEQVSELIQNLPLHANLFDVMRTSVGMLHHFDMQANDLEPDTNLSQAVRLIAKIPTMIAVRHNGIAGSDIALPDEEFGFCGRLLKLLTGEEPQHSHERALEALMITRADDCFNASTFAARLVASTGSPVHAAVLAAIGAEQGHLLSGQSDVLSNIMRQLESPCLATTFVLQMVTEHDSIPGFGHAYYKKWDPRERLLKKECERLAIEQDRVAFEENVEAVERVVWEQRQLRPNVDWAAARLLHYIGLDDDLYLAVNMMGRIVGWCAHVIEQSEEHQLYKPLSRYRGPEKLTFVPLAFRE